MKLHQLWRIALWLSRFLKKMWVFWLDRVFPSMVILTVFGLFSYQLPLCGSCKPGGWGVLPYITYTGMCHPTGSRFWSSWFRTGYPFQRRFLERGIIFRTHESSSFVSSHLKLFKDRLLLKIGFNALRSKLLYSLHLRTEYKKLAHSRTGYQF